jgi:hypothetical protein
MSGRLLNTGSLLDAALALMLTRTHSTGPYRDRRSMERSVLNGPGDGGRYLFDKSGLRFLNFWCSCFTKAGGASLVKAQVTATS